MDRTKIKQLAKNLKKDPKYSDLCHGQLLDLISRAAGHKDWNTYSAKLKEQENGVQKTYVQRKLKTELPQKHRHP